MAQVHRGWLAHTKPKATTPLRGRMASHIRARLAEGHTPDDLVLVAEWAAQDAWMSGRHERNKTPYLTMETLYGSVDKTNGYVQKATAWVRNGKPSGLAGMDARRGTQHSYTKTEVIVEAW